MTTTTSADRALHLSGERLPFAMLPRWLLYRADVSEGAKFLYCVLHDLVSGRQGPTRPVTRAELAACCGVSVDTIDRRLAQLVAAGAVEKQAQIRAGGQQANIYMVWLTPPEGLQRSAESIAGPGGRIAAAPGEGGAKGPVHRSRASAAPPGELHGRGSARRAGAAPMNREEREEEVSPQPPRTAGGSEVEQVRPAANGRRATGANPRAMGTHPRSAAEQAEAARLEAEAAARQAALQRATETRQATDRAAELEAERLEAEALAVSAALDDATLAALVDVVTGSMAGPLARSPLAISRAVVAWCRTAAAEHPGRLTDAAALASEIVVREEDNPPAPLDLPPAPAGTALLRHRIAALVRPGGGGVRQW